jgi:hypothetical protein
LRVVQCFFPRAGGGGIGIHMRRDYARVFEWCWLRERESRQQIGLLCQLNRPKIMAQLLHAGGAAQPHPSRALHTKPTAHQGMGPFSPPFFYLQTTSLFFSREWTSISVSGQPTIFRVAAMWVIYFPSPWRSPTGAVASTREMEESQPRFRALCPTLLTRGPDNP